MSCVVVISVIDNLALIQRKINNRNEEPGSILMITKSINNKDRNARIYSTEWSQAERFSLIEENNLKPEEVDTIQIFAKNAPPGDYFLSRTLTKKTNRNVLLVAQEEELALFVKTL